MNVQAIRGALALLAKTAVGAQVYFDKLPTTPPARYPAVIVGWRGWRAAHQVFSGKVGSVSSQRERRIIHRMEVLVLVGLNAALVDADRATATAAGAFQTAVAADETLGGIVVEATVTEGAPEIFGWDQSVAYGFTAMVQVIEEI